jgi:phosphohistidine phosphatase
MTGRFYLVRHARAEGSSPQGDQARRLTPEGRAQFERQARALAEELGSVRILTSPFERAVQTAAILAAATGAPVREDARLASGASTGGQLLALGAKLGDGWVLVGHNPELAEAVALASGGAEHEVPPGTVACVDLPGALRWVRRGP